MNRSIRSTYLLLLFAVAACSRPPQIVGEPVLTMNPSGRTPLAGILSFTTDRPARATLTVGDGENSASATPRAEFATEHELIVLGLRPDRTNTIEISLESADGQSADHSALIEVQTPPLPADTPPVNVVLSRPAAMEPGITLVPLFRWIDQKIDENYSLILALDAQGEVIWVYEAPHSLIDAVPLRNGNLLYMHRANGQLIEIDMLGNVVTEWHTTGVPKDVSATSIPVDTDTFHHDILEMPSGHFLTFSTEVREVPDFPTSETDPDAPRETRNVIGDILLEFARDGTKIREWRFFDLLDTQRIGYNSLSTGFYADVYDEILDEPAPDWTHSNGVFYDAATDTALVSTNHLSTVFKLDLASGKIVWMLGDPRNWRKPWSDLSLKPVGELSWSYHHHAPKLTPAGTVLLYDNGAVRALPPDPPLTAAETYSRAVEYRVDEANGTVQQVWSYGGPGDEIFLSAFISEADWLPQTGNILVTSGGRVRDNDGSVLMFPEEGHTWITLAEVTHTKPAEKVWEVVIDDPAVGWTAFRSERLPSLYRQ